MQILLETYIYHPISPKKTLKQPHAEASKQLSDSFSILARNKMHQSIHSFAFMVKSVQSFLFLNVVLMCHKLQGSNNVNFKDNGKYPLNI